MINIQLNEDAKTLTLEWNNREVARSNGLVIILSVVWVLAIGMLGASIWVVATGQNVGPPALMWFAIAMSVIFIIIIPLRLLNRFTRERVEFSEQQYRFYCMQYPWLFPTNWPVDKISKFTIGHHPNSQGERETMVTLNVWRGWRRSMIGYWMNDEDKYRLFETIQSYFKLIGRDVPFEEDFDEDYYGPSGESD